MCGKQWVEVGRGGVCAVRGCVWMVKGEESGEMARDAELKRVWIGWRESARPSACVETEIEIRLFMGEREERWRDCSCTTDVPTQCVAS